MGHIPFATLESRILKFGNRWCKPWVSKLFVAEDHIGHCGLVRGLHVGGGGAVGGTHKLRGLSPHANYTDRAAAAGRRS